MIFGNGFTTNSTFWSGFVLSYCYILKVLSYGLKKCIRNVRKWHFICVIVFWMHVNAFPAFSADFRLNAISDVEVFFGVSVVAFNVEVF